MTGIDHEDVNTLMEAGRHEDALRLLQAAFGAVEQAVEPTRLHLFMTMFQWQRLVEQYMPARAALAAVRDDQVARLLAGDLVVGRDAAAAASVPAYQRIGRFALIVDMNDTLHDARSTQALFAQLHASHPALARSNAWRALPALVEAGDFALADRYRDDPLALLDAVNFNARTLPLYPPPRQAPRLAADLTNLVRDARIGIAVLRGLGDEGAADALRAALLDGLEDAAVRALAQRELEAPGTITREIVERRMAQDDAGPTPPP
jgi:hypothetical protein